jgi:hypothetical protein
VNVFRGLAISAQSRQEIALTRRVLDWAASNSKVKSCLAGTSRKMILGVLGTSLN